MLFESDASKDRIFHTNDKMVQACALVTVCSCVLTQVSGEGDKP